jgi:predicted acylesterase/phospholipase RssA
MASVEDPIRILSIDGGGMRGIIPAMILRKLDELVTERLAELQQPPRPLASFFDIVAGTSTGAIIAAGIAGCKVNERRPLASPAELFDFYINDAAKVFVAHWWRLGLWRPKFATGQKTLEQQFARICGDARLSDAASNLIIPAFKGDGAFMFRGGPKWRNEPDFYLRDVLAATTAAPCFFPPARFTAIGQPRTQHFIDGGMFANNPAMHAYLDARELFDRQREILLVSLGTGSDFYPIDYHGFHRSGGAKWLNPRKGVPIIQTMMQGQSHDTDGVLRRLIPDPRSYIRLDIRSTAPMPSFDDATPPAVQFFCNMAEELLADSNDRLVALSHRLVSARVVPSPASAG